MDFHTLSRKQLQTLCKKNKIPANITNVAMAQSLASLDHVEGLDEFLNPGEIEAGTPDVGRVSNQRKSVREEAQRSKVKVSTSTRGAKAAKGGGGVVEEENRDANVTVSAAVSTRGRKKGSEDDDKNVIHGKPADVPITPAAPPSSRTRAYNTRRSVRFLEKNMSKMSFMDAEDMGLPKIDDVSQELSDVSQQLEDSSTIEKGDSLQTVSTMVSEESEVSSNDSASQVKLVSVTENVMEAGLKDDEPQEEDVNGFEDETHDSSLIVEEICESNERGSEVLLALEESFDTSQLESGKKECVGASPECLHVDASRDAMQEFSDQEIAAVLPSDDVSVDVTEEDVAASMSLKDSDSDSDEAGYVVVPLPEDTCDSSKLEEHDEKATEEKDFASSESSFELDLSTFCSSDEAAEEKDFASSESSFELDLSTGEATEATEESKECGAETEKFDNASDVISENSVAVVEVSPESSADGNGSIDVQDVALESSLLGEEAEDRGNKYENLKAEKQAEEDVTLESSLLEVEAEDYENKSENLEAEEAQAKENVSHASLLELEAENHEENSENMEAEEVQAKENVSHESSLLELEAEDHADNSENMEAESQTEENVTLESSLLEVEDHKYNSENFDAEEAQAEESEEHAAGEYPENAFSSGLEGIHEQVYVEYSGTHTDSYHSDGVLSCNSNKVVDAELVSEDTVTTDLEPRVSSETMRVAPIYAQKTSDVPIQSVVSDELKRDLQKADTMKENLTADELHKKSMGELKRMLKMLAIGDKSNCKTNDVVKDVKKRTALQAIPQNQMTKGEVHKDG